MPHPTSRPHVQASRRSTRIALAGFAVLCGIWAASSEAACCPPAIGGGFSWTVQSPEFGGPVEGVVADSRGGVFFLGQIAGEVRLVATRDDGESWEIGDREFTLNADLGALVLTSSDRLLLVYEADRRLLARYSDDQARTFSEPLEIWSHPVRQASFVTVEAGSGDTVACVLTGVDLNSGTDGALLGVAVSTDQGETWGEFKRIVDQNTNSISRMLAVSASVVGLVTREVGGLGFRRSLDAGENWSPPTILTEPGEDVLPLQRDFQLGSTRPGEFRFLYLARHETEPNTVRIRMTVSADSGGTWTTPETIGLANWGPGARSIRITDLGGGDLLVGNWFEPDGRSGALTSVSRSFSDPGSWSLPAARLAVEGIDTGRYFFTRLLGEETLLATHWDWRDDGSDCPLTEIGCRSAYLACSEDFGATWLAEEFRLDVDTPDALLTGATVILTSSSGRVHALMQNIGLAGSTGHQLTLDFFDAPTPGLSLTSTVSANCGPRVEVTVVETTGLACTSTVVTWFVDGVEQLGQTGEVLALSEIAPPGLRQVRAELSCLGLGPCSASSGTLDVEVPAAEPALAILIESLLGDDCVPSRYRLTESGPAATACADPVRTWFVDGEVLDGETGPVLLLTTLDLPPGDHSVHLRLSCPSVCEASAEPVLIAIEPPRVPAPADVGPVLFVTDHGPAYAADITARLSWIDDQGAPRPAGEHFHVRRNSDPRTLVFLSGHEPLAGTEMIDSTPSFTELPGVHYYKVFAANLCELVSAD